MPKRFLTIEKCQNIFDTHEGLKSYRIGFSSRIFGVKLDGSGNTNVVEKLHGSQMQNGDINNYTMDDADRHDMCTTFV